MVRWSREPVIEESKSGNLNVSPPLDDCENLRSVLVMADMPRNCDSAMRHGAVLLGHVRSVEDIAQGRIQAAQALRSNAQERQICSTCDR